ncbi:hypothetical protein [Streptosporangium lutulentum]|uniref:Uncharacterized protein n=1 Tax=Streptosporangium lutulentum TaxID=1461250 RepID=A0ABT9QL20_9ACTN|nr:hypothetical protein [Streptosporangium lutulentum]MDP9847455.1 hypothetical protein [Streptosporangium lutulentum]
MALRDWDVVGDMALRHVNGQAIIVRKGLHGSLPVAVAVWEAREQQLVQARLIELGRLVDGAMDRLHARSIKIGLGV